MMTLRPYQLEAISLLRKGFKNHKRIILCLPTGAGKTVVFSEMIRLAYNKGTRVLVLTDRMELCAQTLKAISHHNINPQIMDAKTKMFYPSAPVTLSMSETMKRRMKKWDSNYYQPKLIIADEAHKQSFNKILDAFPESSVIGATATPKSKTIHKYYSNIVNNIDIPELIEDGFLAPCKAYMMQDNFDDVDVVRGEYDKKQLFTHFDKNLLYKGVVKNYNEKTPGQKALVFCVNIEHSHKMNEEFRNEGIHSEVVTSKTKIEERKRIVDAFGKGHFKVLVNCGCLTTGYDESSIETIIVNRATLSLPLWLQMCGRGSRPHPGKTHFTILDHGNNHLTHGLWNEAREWSLAPPLAKKKKGVAPVRSCQRCGAMLAASARVCEFCGYVFQKTTHEQKEGVLVEVKPQIPDDLKGRNISSLSVDELVRLGKTNAVSKPFIWRVIRSRGVDAIEKFGWEAGYAPGWAFAQKKELNDCKFRDRVL